MTTPAPKIYFVAGGTRGIGLGLVAGIAARDPTAIIYAGGRNLSSAQLLIDLSAKYPGRIEPVKYIAGDKEGNEELAKEIGKKHGHVDTVIANAGIANSDAPVHETSIKSFEEHFSVNVLGPIVLFQTFRDLLKASPSPRFVAISSGAGSIEGLSRNPFNNSPYGTSKAALNWVVRKIHYENDWLIAYPQCPGAVDTDMMREGIAKDTTGKFKEIMKIMNVRQPDEAATVLLDILDASTREKDGGQFHNIDLGRHPW
ncbi:NAD(P)-binding protein [Pholiota conissans]|uniref:NAD(P)-binding protein n=1 Tax=Pholiota conissans TaxID=109636 RepID=A0A9P6CWU8_9AGAR|nr:NAD(P)-binding protein [Pholiota conissans]